MRSEKSKSFPCPVWELAAICQDRVPKATHLGIVGIG